LNENKIISQPDLGESSENVDPIFGCWESNVENFVKSSRSKDGWIDDIRPIGGSHEKNPSTGFDSVHLSQQLINNATGTTLMAVLRSSWAKSVEFVKEDDTRNRTPGALETLSDGSFRFSYVLWISNEKV
jgi:hypothetical protein